MEYPKKPTCYFPYRLIICIGIGCSNLVFYCIRTALSVAVLPMAEQFQWDDQLKGYVLSSFFIGYMITQILGGYLSKKWGGNIFTILMPPSAYIHLYAFIASNIAFGLSGGLHVPTLQALYGHWFPKPEKARLNSLLASFVDAGNICAALFSPLLVELMGWESMFYIYGSFGLLWSILFSIFGASTPQTCRFISKYELKYFEVTNGELGDLPQLSINSPEASQSPNQTSNETPNQIPNETPNQIPNETSNETSNQKTKEDEEVFIELEDQILKEDEEVLMELADQNGGDVESPEPSMNEIPSKKVKWYHLFTCPAVWAIIIAHVCNNWSFYVLNSWLPNFFKSLKVEFKYVGYFTVSAYLATLIAGNISGFISDWMINRYKMDTGTTRKIMQTIAFIGQSIFLFCLRFTNHLWIATILMVSAFAAFSCSRNGFSVNIIDIAPKYGAVIMGISNTFATLPGVIGNIITGWLLGLFNGSWTMVFNVVIGVNFFGCLVFLIFASGNKLFD